MPKFTRLRLHVEIDLVETRVTPSPRKRDPRSAKDPMPRLHVMTDEQEELWQRIVPRLPKNERISIEAIMRRVQAVVRDGSTVTLVDHDQVYMIEIVEPRKETTHKHPR